MNSTEVFQMVRRTVTPRCLHAIGMMHLECIFRDNAGDVFILDGRVKGHYIVRVFHLSAPDTIFTFAQSDLIEGVPGA